ncbi:lamin tail domain-containing protein [Mycoplasmatota bacterium]|nr:lamin tail domain-containing protein [Mycoplasmatota bacterium]
MFRALKKYSFVLVIVFLLVLTACQNDEKTTTTEETTTTEQTTTEDTTTTTEDPEVAKVAEAKAALILGDLSQVKSNLTLPTAGRHETTITWVSSNPDVLSNEGVVTRPENGSGNVHLTLTATITLNDVTDTKEFDVRVIEEDAKVGGTIASVLDQSKDTVVTIDSGIVFALRDKGYYVYDETGFMYIYTGDAPTVTVGDALLIQGTLDIYYDQPEIKNVTKADVISSDNAMPTPVESTIADIVAFDTKVKTNYSQYLTVVGTVTLDETKVYITDDNSNKIRVLGDPETVSAFEGKKVSINVVIDSYHSTALEWRITFANNAGDITEINVSDQEALTSAVSNLTLDDLVYGDLSLATTSGDVAIAWTTDNADVITTDGTVTRPAQGESDVTVKLTATLTIGDLTETKEFTLTVKALNVITLNDVISSDSVDYIVDVEGIVYGVIQQGYFLYDGTATIYVYTGSAPTVVKGDEVRITGEYTIYNDQTEIMNIESTVALTSCTYSLPTAQASSIADIVNYLSTDKTVYGSYLTVEGIVTKEISGSYTNWYLVDGQGNKIMVYYKSEVDEVKAFEGKNISINVIVYRYNNDEWQVSFIKGDTISEVALTDQQLLDSAKQNLTLPSEDITSNDLVNELGGVTISWASSDASVITIDETTGVVTINRPAAGTPNATVTLTATLTINGLTDTKEFTVVVKALDILTIAEARDAAVDTNITIKGIVIGLIGNNIFLQDGTAGIYVYVGGTAQTDFVVGNEVIISGTRDEYKGLIQLGDVTSVEKFSEGNTLPTATEYTTIAELIAADLQSQLVTLKEVTITELPTDLTYGGNIVVSDGTDTYTLRIDKYLNPKIDVTLLNVKDVITVTAPLGCYNTSQIMLRTDADITVVTAYVPTDAEVVQAAIDSVSISAETTSDLSLPTDIEGVTVVWSSDNAAIDASGVVTRPANGVGDVTVTLTATFTLNDETQTITYTVVVKEEAPAGGTVATDLFFSEIIEGGSNNKAIEIYNGTGKNITDLSVYTVELYSNGGTTPSQTLTLSGSLAAGQVFIIGNSSAVAAIKDIADVESNVTWFNGDDALVLKNDGAVIDSFGQLGVDPGSSWTSGDVSTANMTLVRKSTISSGDTVTDDAFDPSVEWVAHPQDTFTELGSHTME